MNRNIASILVVTAAAFAGHASAETPTVDTANFVSTKARSQVQAELIAYKQAGVNPWSTQYNPMKSFRSTQTRGEVVAQYMADRDEVAATIGEDSGSTYFAHGATKQPPVSTTLAGDFIKTN